MRQIAVISLGAVLLVLGASCAEDLLGPNDATDIFGRLVLSSSEDGTDGIFNVGVGIFFDQPATSPQGFGRDYGQSPKLAQQPTLSPPFPNPGTNPIENPIRIRVVVPEATPGTVEIWSLSLAVNRPVATLDDDGFEVGENIFTWNGRENSFGDHLPNGLYTARVTFGSGESASVVEENILINRPVTDAIALGIFDDFSDVNGAFSLLDVPVGETYTATNGSGAVQGLRTIGGQIRIYTCDIDFQHKETVVQLNPKERLDVEIRLTPRAQLRLETLVSGLLIPRL